MDSSLILDQIQHPFWHRSGSCLAPDVASFSASILACFVDGLLDGFCLPLGSKWLLKWTPNLIKIDTLTAGLHWSGHKDRFGSNLEGVWTPFGPHSVPFGSILDPRVTCSIPFQIAITLGSKRLYTVLFTIGDWESRDRPS